MSSHFLFKNIFIRCSKYCMIAERKIVTNELYLQIVRSYAMKSNLPVKWIRPEKISCLDPRKSGDLEPLKKINLRETTVLEFRDSEELKNADPLVKRVFSLEFSPHNKTVLYLRQEYVNLVKNHGLDYSSPPARIARMTVDIRDMQNHIESHPYNKQTKIRLKETIDKRKRLLKHMRRWDYKMFEWILEKLNLFFKPQPPYEAYKRVERKRSLRALTREYCNNIRNDKLLEYKTYLEDQQEDFLKNKIQTIKWIMKEEAECGVSPSLSDQDLTLAEKQLEEWRKQSREAPPADEMRAVEYR